MSSGCDFMVGLGKTKLCNKFELPSFNDCININGEPQILGAPLAQGQFAFEPPFEEVGGNVRTSSIAR